MNNIAYHILDLTNNSIRAKATRISIDLRIDENLGRLGFQIIDNGCGMTETEVNQALDPFFTTRKNRKVGFGLPFIKMSVEQTGGTFLLESEKNKGTLLKACFHTHNIDILPVGDVPGVIAIILTSHPDISIRFHYQENNKVFSVSNEDLLSLLQGFPPGHVKIISLIKQFLEDNININKKLEVYK